MKLRGKSNGEPEKREQLPIHDQIEATKALPQKGQ
jgi:hypothetical protein